MYIEKLAARQGDWVRQSAPDKVLEGCCRGGSIGDSFSLLDLRRGRLLLPKICQCIDNVCAIEGSSKTFSALVHVCTLDFNAAGSEFLCSGFGRVTGDCPNMIEIGVLQKCCNHGSTL